MVTSVSYPARYKAFGGADISYDIKLMKGDMEFNDEFAISFDDKGFTGHANVMADEYKYELHASSGGLMDDRGWTLLVNQRSIPDADATTPTDARDGANTEGLAANGFIDGTRRTGETSPEARAVGSDWANFVPDDFAPGLLVSATNAHIQKNIPRMRLDLGDPAADPVEPPEGFVVRSTMNSSTDVDVFWLGALAPNWMLEVAAIGRSTRVTGAGVGDHNEVMVELYRHSADGPDMKVDLDAPVDPTYHNQTKSLDCGNYYIQVSGVGAGGEGEYDLAWKVSAFDTPTDS